METEDAHKFFSADCFNRSWDLIDKESRKVEEDEAMLFLSIASHWHWQQRKDYDNEKASIGYWHTSRVYSLLGDGENAKKYAEKCLSVSSKENVGLFYLGYAYEALARACKLLGEDDSKVRYLAKAEELSNSIEVQDLKDALKKDLGTI